MSIPSLSLSDSEIADVVVHLYPDCEEPPVGVADLLWVRDPLALAWKANTPDGCYLKLGYIAEEGSALFVLNPSGTEMWIAWSGTATIRDVAALLSGPVQSCLLRVRGHTLLHSSVVAVDGRGLAMIGTVKAGKSTTAMALLQLGATVLSDDIAVLVERGDGFDVRPCDPRLRLGQDSAEVYGSYADLQELWSPGENRPQKRLYRNADPRAEALSDVPLGAIYLLEPREPGLETTMITGVPTTEAILKLMANRFMAYTLERAEVTRDFQCLCRVASRTPVRSIRRPDSLALLPAVSEAILSDFRALR